MPPHKSYVILTQILLVTILIKWGPDLLSLQQFITAQSRLLTTLKKKGMENTVGKGGKADQQHFLLLPQLNITLSEKRNLLNVLTFNLSLAKFSPLPHKDAF